VMTDLPRWRILLAVVAALLAVAAIAIVAALVFEISSKVRLGFRIVRPHDVEGAAQLAAVLCGIFVVSAWRHRVVRHLGIAAMVTMLLVALTVHAAGAARRYPFGDHALIESYTLLAAQGRLFVGPYSRFGWHHPGPLYFWLAAPFYTLAKYHTGGLAVAVLVINVASIGTIVSIARRFASAPVLVAVLIGLTAYVWRLDGIFMSLWNPHVPVLPVMALTIVCAAVAAGQAGLIPLAVSFASFAAQTHVGLLPYCAAVTGLAIVLHAIGARGQAEWLDLRTRRILNVSAWLLVLLWSGPLAEQLSGDPGNLTLLWQFFVADRERPTVAAAYVAWSNNLGALFVPDVRLRNNAFVPSAATWPLVWAAAETLLLIPAIAWLRSTGRRFDAAFASVVLGGLLVSLWSVTRIVDTITEYGIVWISAIGVLASAALAGTSILMVAARTRTARVLPGATRTIVLAVCVAALTAKTWTSFAGYQAEAPLPRGQRQARDLYQSVSIFIRDAHVRKPLLRMRGDTWSATAGVALQLQLAGQDFAVEPGALALFTRAFAPDGREDVEITFLRRPNEEEVQHRLGSVRVAAVGDVYAEAVLLCAAGTPDR
jgi:hypothetical protein